jgi:hypothetical protein
MRIAAGLERDVVRASDELEQELRAIGSRRVLDRLQCRTQAAGERHLGDSALRRGASGACGVGE